MTKENVILSQFHTHTHTLGQGHIFRKLTCGKCGYCAKSKRKYNWNSKTKRDKALLCLSGWGAYNCLSQIQTRIPWRNTSTQKEGFSCCIQFILRISISHKINVLVSKKIKTPFVLLYVYKQITDIKPTNIHWSFILKTSQFSGS